MEERLRSHYESLARAIGFVKAADTKAAPVLALQIALVGTLAARSEKLWDMVVRPTGDAESALLLSLIALYILSLLFSVALAGLVYVPRNPSTEESLIYFEDISSMPFERFEERARGMSPAAIERQLLDQIYRVSAIASVKMQKVRWAFASSAVSVPLWIVLLAWGSI